MAAKNCFKLIQNELRIDVEGRQRRLTGSQLIRKVYEIDPLLCPYCGSQPRVVAFLIDFASPRRFLAHLGFAPQQPEPLAHAPPDETELYVSNAWSAVVRVPLG